MKLQSDDAHTVINFGNALLITENASDDVWIVELVDANGFGITEAQFTDGVRTNGFAKACETFKKLGEKL